MVLRIMELEAEIEELKRRLRQCRCGAAEGLDLDVGFCSTLFRFRWPFKKRKVLPAPPPKDSDETLTKNNDIKKKPRAQSAKDTLQRQIMHSRKMSR
jgi:hypothetical protein